MRGADEIGVSIVRAAAMMLDADVPAAEVKARLDTLTPAATLDRMPYYYPADVYRAAAVRVMA